MIEIGCNIKQKPTVGRGWETLVAIVDRAICNITTCMHYHGGGLGNAYMYVIPLTWKNTAPQNHRVRFTSSLQRSGASSVESASGMQQRIGLPPTARRTSVTRLTSKYPEVRIYPALSRACTCVAKVPFTMAMSESRGPKDEELESRYQMQVWGFGDRRYDSAKRSRSIQAFQACTCG